MDLHKTLPSALAWPHSAGCRRVQQKQHVAFMTNLKQELKLASAIIIEIHTRHGSYTLIIRLSQLERVYTYRVRCSIGALCRAMVAGVWKCVCLLRF